ncbi:MAG: DUF2333 family protein, partial [Pseudomonadales bacterium]
MDMFDRIKMTKDDIADWWDSGFIPRAIGGFLVVYILFCTVFSFMWSSEPELFDVAERAAQISEEEQRATVTGSVTAVALIEV